MSGTEQHRTHLWRSVGGVTRQAIGSSLLDVVRQQTLAVNYGRNGNYIYADPINDSVAINESFTDRIIAHLGYDSASIRESCDLARNRYNLSNNCGGIKL